MSQVRCPSCKRVFTPTGGRIVCPDCGHGSRVARLRNGAPTWLPVAVFAVVLVIIIALIAVQFREGGAFGGGGGIDSNPRIPLSLSPGGDTPGGFDPDDVPAEYGVLENASGAVKSDLTYTGTGRGITESFAVSGGLLQVRMEHYGSDQYFRLTFIDAANGKTVPGGLLTAYKPGAYEATRYVGVLGGDYRIEIIADGAWFVRIDYPDAAAPKYSPNNFVGEGPESPGAVVLARGAHTMRFEHLGNHPFELKVWAANGTRLPDSTGCWAYEPQTEPKERPCNIPVQGLYFFDVYGDGAWRIEF